MSEVRNAAVSDHGAKRLRLMMNAAATAQALLFVGLFVTIARHANPKSDGMEFVATMPATLILLMTIAPALSFRREPRRFLAGVVIALLGVILNIAFFLEIVREFAEAAAA